MEAQCIENFFVQDFEQQVDGGVDLFFAGELNGGDRGDPYSFPFLVLERCAKVSGLKTLFSVVSDSKPRRNCRRN